jgi:hypothetical protein
MGENGIRLPNEPAALPWKHLAKKATGLQAAATAAAAAASRRGGGADRVRRACGYACVRFQAAGACMLAEAAGYQHVPVHLDTCKLE